MKLHRFARLRSLRAAAYGFLAAIAALLWIIWDLLTNADFLSAKYPAGASMPIEGWIFVLSLGWLILVAFWPEFDKAEQPDIALVWEWPFPQRHERALRQSSDITKSIMVHNRSKDWIYNVQTHPIQLKQEMTFDLITELSPAGETVALARWSDKSSLSTELHYYFCNDNNEKEALKKKWHKTKTHNRGLSPYFLQIPMRVTYEANNRLWEHRCDFIYDVGLDSMFQKTSQRRI